MALLSYRYLFFLAMGLAGALLGSALSPAAESSQNRRQNTPAKADFPRGDATSDPLLLLLRAPRIRQALALQKKQVESLDDMIAEIDEPLWRLRDAQFIIADNSMKAWQLIDQLESGLRKILDQEQQAKLRKLLVQARGLQGLLANEVIERLRLSPATVHQIADAFEETRRQIKQLRQDF
ncbi:MAG: hypothetical protein ACWGMZ_10360, partial [Thermoguttaceae bacterium]